MLTKISEHRVDQRCPETKELSGVACEDIRYEGPRVFVVLESSGFALRSSSNREKEGQENQANNDDDFDTAEPELEFTKKLYTEVVDGYDSYKENGNPHSRIDFFGCLPFLNDQRGCSQIVRRNDDVLEPICISERETKRRVDETGSISSEARGLRKPCCHLAKSAHDNVNEETDDSVGDED